MGWANTELLLESWSRGMSLQALGHQPAVPAFPATRCLCTIAVSVKTQTLRMLSEPVLIVQNKAEKQHWPSKLCLKPWEEHREKILGTAQTKGFIHTETDLSAANPKKTEGNAGRVLNVLECSTLQRDGAEECMVQSPSLCSQDLGLTDGAHEGQWQLYLAFLTVLIYFWMHAV